MPRGIIFVTYQSQIRDSLTTSLLKDCKIIYLTDVIVPSPYAGYFWNGNDKVMVSDYDYAIIMPSSLMAKSVYLYLKDHIKVFGNPFVRDQLVNKVTSQLIVSNAGIPVVPFVYGQLINPLIHLNEFKDQVVEKPYNLSCGANVNIYPLPISTIKEDQIYQQYIECDSTDERWIIVGDRIVSAMRRHSTEIGEFRANISLGGVGEPIDITDDMQEFAKRIIDQFPGYFYAGIDIITDRDGNRYYLEGNIMPGEKIIEITNHNYFDDLYNYIISNLKEDEESIGNRTDL